MKNLDEAQIIQRFMNLGKAPAAAAIGIGDDCAVLPQPGGKSLLVTTDLLTEGVHFLAQHISAYQLGRKSLAVSLSDIAAMGGVPHSAFLSLALPRSISSDWVDDFARGLDDLAREHHVSLMGGDTTASLSGITVNVTLLGDASTSEVKLRSMGKPGDVLAVTGALGDSRAGLDLILGAATPSADAATLIARHYDPLPECAAGRFLGAQSCVHAMMDLSDGLYTDLQRLAQASHCGALVDVEQLPVSEELRRHCGRSTTPAHELALSGGEDYRLLLSVEASGWEHLATGYLAALERPLHRIGKLTSETEVRYLLQGQAYHLAHAPFEHFASAS